MCIPSLSKVRAKGTIQLRELLQGIHLIEGLTLLVVFTGRQILRTNWRRWQRMHIFCVLLMRMLLHEQSTAAKLHVPHHHLPQHMTRETLLPKLCCTLTTAQPLVHDTKSVMACHSPGMHAAARQTACTGYMTANKVWEQLTSSVASAAVLATRKHHPHPQQTAREWSWQTAVSLNLGVALVPKG